MRTSRYTWSLLLAAALFARGANLAHAQEVPSPEVPAPTPAHEEPARRDKIIAAALWAAGGASFALATGFGVAALRAKGAFEDAPSSRYADRAEDRALVADLSIAVGISLVLIGTFTYLAGRSESDDLMLREHGKQLSIAPVVSAQGGGAAVTGSF